MKLVNSISSLMVHCIERAEDEETNLHPSMVVVDSPMLSLSSDPVPALYVTAATPKLVSISMGHTYGLAMLSTLS
jgi:hypothetical protein